MTQTTFTQATGINFEGDLVDGGTNEIVSKTATDDIEFGRFLVYSDNDKVAVNTIGTNKVTLALSGALVASNVFAFTLKIKNEDTGVETVNAMTETYASSSDATLDALVLEIEELTGISASGTSRSGNSIIIGASSGYIIEVSGEAVTLGASQATVTKTNEDTRVKAGMSVREDLEPFLESGSYVSRYRDGEVVNVARKGNVTVYSTGGFTGASTLYALGYGSDRGRIDGTVGNNGIAIGTYVTHYHTASAAGKGAVSVNMPV